MITRIFRVQIKSALRAEFERDFQHVSLPAVQSHSGLLSVQIGKGDAFAKDEYVMISCWKSIDHIIQFAGSDYHQPVIPEGMTRYIVNCWVHHFAEM